jgi:hypothetical protein
MQKNLNKFSFSTRYKTFEIGGIIAGGVLHSEKNELGDRGIPVIPIQHLKQGGEYDKNTKVAEIEKEEIIFTAETALEIDKLVDEYNDCKCPMKLVDLGKLVFEALKNTSDETCRTKCEFKPKLDKIK